MPVFKQLAGHRGDAGITSITPRIDTLTDAIDQIKLNSSNRVSSGVENLVARRTTPGHQLQLVVALALPVVRRPLEGRTDDQGLGFAHSTPLSSAR